MSDDSKSLLPCPLCQSNDVLIGACYVGDSNKQEPAARCANCSCRATLKAWNTRAAPVPQCDETFEIEDGPPEWLWYGETETGKPVVTFGRWPKQGAYYRYKIAEIQPTEHDKSPPSSSDADTAPLLLPTPEQIEPILDDFLGVDSPHYEELRKRCAQRIFDLCVVMSGIPK